MITPAWMCDGVRHTPGGHPHNQQSHGGDGVNGVDLSEFALNGIEIYSPERIKEIYGDVWNDAGVRLGDDDVHLAARYFDSGDMHVSWDLPDGSSQVLEEMDPESMRRLADDIESVLDDYDYSGIDPDDYGPTDAVFDVDSDKHGFYIYVDRDGDVRIDPRGGGTSESAFDVSARQAREFVAVLNDIADSYEEHFSYGEGRSRTREEITMSRNETQRCGSCGDALPESLVNSRHAVRGRHTGKLLCDRCGIGASPYEGAELCPVRNRLPKSREVLRHEVAVALDPARFRSAPAFDETAIHEAGHTVVGWQLLVPIDAVRLGDHGSGDSVMRSGDRGDTVRAAITLGGDMAVERWCPDSPADEHAPELRAWLADEDVDVDLAVSTVEDILIRHREEVELLAQALAEHRGLTGDQVYELLDRSYNKRIRCDGCGQMWPASKMVAHDEDHGEKIMCMNCLGIPDDGSPVATPGSRRP